MGDIDRIIEQVKVALPGVRCERLTVTHPADDDGLWFFELPGVKRHVQAESSSGMCPFLVETRWNAERTDCTTVEATADSIVA